MFAKRFCYVCLGILCLSFAYHLGATRADAQGSKKGEIRFVDARGSYVVVVNENDDIYVIDPSRLTGIAHGTGWWKFNLDSVR